MNFDAPDCSKLSRLQILILVLVLDIGIDKYQKPCTHSNKSSEKMVLMHLLSSSILQYKPRLLRVGIRNDDISSNFKHEFDSDIFLYLCTNGPH